MKNKSKFFIYIVAIVLSLSVLVYGVYSAKQATLNVSGKVAFTAHNCEGTAQLVKVEGALNADGTDYTLADEDTASAVSWKDSGTLTLTNPMYFDDISTRNPQTGDYLDEDVKINPIVITIQMTNTSAYAVKATAKSATLQTNEATPADITGVTYSYSQLDLTAKNTTGATAEFKITITPSADLTTLNVTSFLLSVELVKNV